MPRRGSVSRLEDLCLFQFSDVVARFCTKLEEKILSVEAHQKLILCSLESLPSPLLESVIPSTLKIVAASIRKNRSHKGLLKALELLLRPTVHRLDIGALFNGVRLYGKVNHNAKTFLKSCLCRLPGLTVLNLSSKCTDEMLIELAKHCRHLTDLNVTLSDITDRGLMSLCGISIYGSVHPKYDGCYNLVNLGLKNCMNVTISGVGCVLRNLTKLKTLHYDKCADAVEALAKIDADYILGRKCFNVIHLDHLGAYYDFEAHQDIIDILIRVCPKLESLRFFTTDYGFQELSRLDGIKYLQLETENVIGSGFQKLISRYSQLVSLEMTFRFIHFEYLNHLAENLQNLEILRLIGFQVEESHRLVPRDTYFRQLRVIDMRMVRQDEFMDDVLEDEDDDEDEEVDTVTPALMEFFINPVQSRIEDFSVAAIASFISLQFVSNIIAKIRLCKKFALASSPSSLLTLEIAKYVIENLDELETIYLSRWKIHGKDLKNLINDLKMNNIDVTII